MDYSRPELADRLAAGYVIGTMRAGARRRFEVLLPAHPALRAAERAWQDRLMPLTLAIKPEQPSAEVWQRIEARLFGQQAQAQAAPAAAVWWRQLGFWRGFSALAGVAALSLGVMLANPGATAPPVLVVLMSTNPVDPNLVAASFVASISGDGRALVTRPLLNVSLQADRSFELWSIPTAGKPRSLGVISASGKSVVNPKKELAGAEALAVTLEPVGGSPSGQPTGPIVFSGKLTL